MLLANAPLKLPLPFASGAGSKTNPIPEASQIGVTAGAASLTDGFPPLCLTPIEAGGVPPSGNDMNGILFEATAIARWSNAGGGYKFDGTFAADANVTGYPQGARVLRSDGLGYWLNTTDANTLDPEGGTQPSGWLPDFTTGAASVTMTNANVTLTPLQWGRPVVVITGVLTASVNLIFPAIIGEWTVLNQTTGTFTITCKTPSGSGVTVSGAQAISGDGTNIYTVSGAAGALLAANNLSDVANPATSLTNLSGVSTTTYTAGKQFGHAFITAGTTWTSPAGITSATKFKITLVGAGGGCNAGSALSGAGAGATGTKYLSGLAASTAYTIAIGAGGVSSGGNGGNTTFNDGTTTYTAGGGTGNPSGAGPVAGGTCTNCDIPVAGQASVFSNNSSGGFALASGGSSLWGGGGQQGANPTGFGAGAAGTSVVGAPGMILIEWVQ